MTMITPSYLGETIEYSSLHACRSTLEDPTNEKDLADIPKNVLDTLDVYLVQTMDEVLKIALAEPLAGRLPAEAQAEPVGSAVVDDTITH